MRRLDPHALAAEEVALLVRVRDAVRRAAPGAEVILYGSRARREARADSDYDLLVLLERSDAPDVEEVILREVYPIELETGAALTLMVYSKSDWVSPLQKATPFFEHVDRDGVFL